MKDLFSFLNEAVFFLKLNQDDREEFIVFQSTNLDKAIGFRAPNIWFWTQLLTMFFVTKFIASIFACIVYKFIIQQRKSQSSLIIGYGLMIPLCLYVPFVILDTFETGNIIVRFFVTIPFTLGMFRTMEAMYGYSLDGSEVSLSSYVIYYTAMGEVQYDKETKKPKKATVQIILKKKMKFIMGAIALGVFASMFYPNDYKVVETSINSVWDLYSMNHLINNFVLSVITQGTLTIYGIALSAMDGVLCQVDTIDIMKNAIFDSRSPADFWGKKWNLVVHGALKRGVFKPVRSYFSLPVAVMSTFVASGLFHEWINLVVFPPDPDYYYEQVFFFIYCGLLVGLEMLLVPRVPIFSYLAKKLPGICITMLLAVTLAFPFVHFFNDRYLYGGFFHHSQIGLPTVVLMDKN